MKVYIGKYRNRLTCNIYSKYMDKKYGLTEWPEEQSKLEDFLEKLDDYIQDFLNIFNKIYFDKRKDQIKYIKIDNWDVWSMDTTLADIILPMLIKIKEDHHGAPYVDIEDVPEFLHPTETPKYDVDNTHFERWVWVLDEMIFAFSSKTRDWESDYYGEFIYGEDGGISNGDFDWRDDEGRKQHQLRMNNGFRLFGKYYEALWT